MREKVISNKDLKILIGTKEIIINDRFTLILGKFKKNLINHYDNDAFLNVIRDLNLIQLEDYIRLFHNNSNQYSNFKKALNLLELLKEFRKVSEFNDKLISEYIEIEKSLSSIIKYRLMLKRRDVLLNELTISQNYKKTSNVATITNLINGLSRDIDSNKKKLKYLEEDYFKRRTHIIQILKTISDYELQIATLNKEKKQCFSQINQITRQMENFPSTKTEEPKDKEPLKKSISNAEKIQGLQKKAREIQFQINETQSKLEATKIKFDNYEPQFKTYEKDYLKINQLIEKDEKRILDLQHQLNEALKNDINLVNLTEEAIDLKTIRPVKEIDEELQKVNVFLKNSEIPEAFFNPQNPNDLSNIKKKLTDIEKTLSKNGDRISINKKEQDITNVFKHFEKLENNIKNLEKNLNKFLYEINLESKFLIVISKDFQNFFLQLEFLKNNKEKVDFNSLTTPEKIFFIISFFISINILQKSENIIFSNLFLPNNYNKRGSIFRTIRKILPLFEFEGNLKRFNLIFILSNLEQKGSIKNLKIINIEES